MYGRKRLAQILHPQPTPSNEKPHQPLLLFCWCLVGGSVRWSADAIHHDVQKKTGATRLCLLLCVPSFPVLFPFPPGAPHFLLGVPICLDCSAVLVLLVRSFFLSSCPKGLTEDPPPVRGWPFPVRAQQQVEKIQLATAGLTVRWNKLIF